VGSLADYMKRPITIQGREVVLVADLVGPVPISEQHQYVESVVATNTCPTIHVRESDIEDIRERFPEHPVFGLWSVLIESGLVSVKRTLQVVPVTAEDGYYIHCDLGRAAYSGIYESGFFAADAGFTLDEAQEISAEPDQLVLPEIEAKLAAELRFERQLVMRKGWSYLAIALVTVVGVAFGSNLALARIYDAAHQQIQSKTEMLEDLQTGVDELRTTRLTEVPNNKAELERLAVLWNLYPDLSTDNNQSFAQPDFTFFARTPDEDPAEKLKWLQTSYEPSGVWTLRFTSASEGSTL